MKPKYNFFKNTRFALEGICSTIRREKSFQIELCVILPAILLSFFLPFSGAIRLILILSLILILAFECVNSAIEACVDLQTNEFHPLAKIAKDCASAAVFCQIIFALFAWTYALGELILTS